MAPIDTVRPLAAGKEALELTAAAARLRLPVPSVERALQRGFIDGYRSSAGQWMVLLDQPISIPPFGDQRFDGLKTSGNPPAEEPANQERAFTAAEPGPEQSGSTVDAPDSVARPATDLQMMRDELHALRDAISQQNHDGAVREHRLIRLLERLTEMNDALVQLMPSADDAYARLERAIRSQNRLTDRHEKDLSSVKDVLGSVRAFLAKNRT